MRARGKPLAPDVFVCHYKDNGRLYRCRFRKSSKQAALSRTWASFDAMPEIEEAALKVVMGTETKPCDCRQG